jgi:molybdopterin molybdotransferase
MISASDAEALILQITPVFGAQQDRECLELAQAQGRVLATTVHSALDFPHWDNSAMDGYAVRLADVELACNDQPVLLDLVTEIPAGSRPDIPVQAGQAARIFTGSMMPTGADTVVMQEETQQRGQQVAIYKAPQKGAFIRQQGSYTQAGAPLLHAGVVLSAPDLAVLAATQCATVTVYRRPRVAILSTGSELVPLGQPLQPGQIVDSNQVAIAALLTASGAEIIRLGIIPDDRAALKSALATATAQADVVISSGGVSVGDYDYVDEILADVGADIHIRKIAVKPGKPLTVATIPAQPRPVLYFGLPGNPASALMTFWRFVQPALRKLSGQTEGIQPQFVNAITRQALQSDGQRETYLWGRLFVRDRQLEFELAAGSHQSGNLINLAQTNAFAVLPVGKMEYAVGSVVQVFPVGWHGNAFM